MTVATFEAGGLVEGRPLGGGNREHMYSAEHLQEGGREGKKERERERERERARERASEEEPGRARARKHETLQADGERETGKEGE